jgi:hypothetical protein
MEMTEKQKHDLLVAKTILQQLGGNQFIAMTGSHNFVYGNNQLVMTLSKNKLNAKYLKITLTPLDTYTMEFFSIDNKTLETKSIKEIPMVYHDQLQEIFTEYTGLFTHL